MTKIGQSSATVPSNNSRQSGPRNLKTTIRQDRRAPPTRIMSLAAMRRGTKTSSLSPRRAAQTNIRIWVAAKIATEWIQMTTMREMMTNRSPSLRACSSLISSTTRRGSPSSRLDPLERSLTKPKIKRNKRSRRRLYTLPISSGTHLLVSLLASMTC